MLNYFFQNSSKSKAAILLNAAFLIALVVSGNANPMAIVFAYIFETVIIGLIHAVKLFCIVRYDNAPGKKEKNLMNYFSIFFFLIHFGGFVAIQSLFLYIAFAAQDARFSTSLSVNIFKAIFQLEGFSVVAISILVTNLAEFFFDFIKNKKYYNQNLGSYFIKPYTRIFMQQFLAIIPFFFLIFTNHVGVIAALLLIGMRVFLDLYAIHLEANPEKLKKIKRFLSKEQPN